ncbi:hypothetical protein PanWU01x14_155470 [Parasponia andersonii]|uniref:Uncharacterized protein n=1 Tax=Parasponia andersonii TaxID=3476 RepID=A0A2P5CG58_PARAD|nr:hypothetical protein PanWU01x14_155470 [Parasponia andersonii]
MSWSLGGFTLGSHFIQVGFVPSFCMLGESLDSKASCDSNPRLPNTETETNPIDRTVAHLLFYRPLEFSGKQLETSESAALSAKLPFERRAPTVVNLPETLGRNSRCFGHQESEVGFVSVDPDQLKDSTHMDTTENFLNNGLADVGTIPATESSH